ncbi:MAG: penicillin-binding protein 1B [Succinivibrionaceae bacterium]
MVGKKVQKKNVKSWKVRILCFVMLLALCLVAVLSVYMYFLDREIQSRFSGEKWKLPAWIYSRPLELYLNQRLSIEQMENELKMLNYRKVYSPKSPGEYAVNKNRMVIIKRPFRFYDGDEEERHIFLVFENKRIVSLKDAKTGNPLAFVRMDPIILDRITIGNEEDRILIRLQDVNPMLIKILLTTEDKNFYEHNGISIISIVRALIANFRAGKNVQGGSTLTQQFAKNFFLTREKTLSRKVKEALMAVIIDARYEKNQILEAYMNEIYLGQNGSNGVYGFGLASYFYFGLPVSELDIDQMAMLVAIVRGPSYYNPWTHPERVRDRRDLILKKLLDDGTLSPEEYEKYASRDIAVVPRGKMTYGKTPAYVDLVKRELKSHLDDKVLGESGLRIFTSFDPITQRSAEEAVDKVGSEFAKKDNSIEVAMAVANWHKGEIVALIGGRNYAQGGMFNRALDARRPIGSTVKPMVYMTAFAQKGYQLGTVINDTDLSVRFGDKVWHPRNYDHRYHGKVFLADALARSLNIPAVRVGIDAGIKQVVANLKLSGATQNISPYPSVVLGTPELTPFELVQMYSVFASQGYYKPLTVIRAVVNEDNDLVYQPDNDPVQLFSPQDSYLLTQGLMGVVDRGTARSLLEVAGHNKLAGKTGTTDNGRDSWFAGFDNDEVSAVWIGRDDNKATGYTGSSGALKVYKEFIRNRGVNSLTIRTPEGIANQRFSIEGVPIENSCRDAGSAVFPAKLSTLGKVYGCYQP